MSQAQADYKIIVEDMHKSFGDKHVLRGVDFKVKKGESLVIIGGSGTGKSVCIKTILGLIQPTSGSISIDGTDLTKVKKNTAEELRQQIGMLFQGGALFDSLNIWQNISFKIAQNQNISAAEARDIANEKLSAVGLDPSIGRLMPSELSGGMQKRVALARAIASNPDIIFFDEPTTGLDPIMADVINDLIVKSVKDLGATTITITHDMHSARKIADHIAMIYEGKMIWQGKSADIDQSGNPYVDQFIHGRSEGPIKMQTFKP